MNWKTVLLLTAGFTGQALGAGWHIATTGSDNQPGSASQPFRTFQRALAAAAAGDSLIFHAGSYPGNNALVNASPDGLVICAARSGGQWDAVTIGSPGQRGLSIERCDGVTVAGLGFSGGTNGVYSYRAEALRIMDCRFSGQSSHALYLRAQHAASGPLLAGNHVEAGSANGLYTESVGPLRLEGNRFSGGSGWACEIQGHGNRAVTLLDNEFQGTPRGVYLGSPGPVDFRRNAVSDASGGRPLAIDGGLGALVVSDNTFARCGGGLQLVQRGAQLISGNTLEDFAGSWAIYADNLGGNPVQCLDNTLRRTAKGIYLNGAGAATLVGNHLEDCTSDWGVSTNHQGNGALIFTGNELLRCAQGALFNQHGRLQADGNRFDSIGSSWTLQAQAGNPDSCVIRSNTFTSCAKGVYLSRGRNLLLTGNTLDGPRADWLAYLDLQANATARLADNHWTGAGQSQGIYLHANGRVELERETLTGALGGRPLYLDAGNGAVEMRSCTLADAASGVFISTGGSLSMADNTLERFARDWGLYLNVSSNAAVTLRGNLLADTHAGLFLASSGALTLEGNTLRGFDASYAAYLRGGNQAGMTIHGNRFEDGADGVWLENGGAVDFQCNLVAGLRGGLLLANQWGRSTVVVGNTFHGNPVAHLTLTNGTAGEIRNNIFSQSDGFAVTALGTFTLDLDHNLYHLNAADFNYLAAPRPGSHNVWADPRFRDAAQGDYSLLADSPCWDAGDPARLDEDGSVSDLGATWCVDPPAPLAVHVEGLADGAELLLPEHALATAVASGGVGSYSYQWISSLDGLLSTQAGLDVELREGTHNLVLVVADGRGQEATMELVVTVRREEVQAGELPVELALRSNHPNPFNPLTTVVYDVPALGHVRLSVHDLAGHRVVTLVDGLRERGRHEVSFDASGRPSGVYILWLEADGRRSTRAITLLK